MQDKKVLISGSGGMLGSSMYEVFSNNYSRVLATDIDLNEPWLHRMDVRNYHECKSVVDEFDPDIILHLAALTDLEYCEKNPEDAWMTNALGTENLALLALQRNAMFVYISTAGIFDGSEEYYNDFELPAPLSVYGKSKYYGEKYVSSHLKNYFIFRAGWMMGGGPRKDKKFINKIFQQIQNGAKKLFVVDDKLGTPTYTRNFADSIFQVIQTDMFGLYNQVCNGSCSRLDVAREFIRNLGLQNDIDIVKVSSDHFDQEYFAPRPRSEKLVNLKLKSRGIDFMHDWKDCLKEYSREFSGILSRTHKQ